MLPGRQLRKLFQLTSWSWPAAVVAAPEVVVVALSSKDPR